MIVVMAGLPGTGKSALARALAEDLRGVVLNKDILRANQFPPELVEYSTAQDDFVQDLMERTTAYLLTRHPKLTVFFDGRTFSRSYQIESVVKLADRLESPWRIIECVCPEEVARRRMEEAPQHPAKNRTFELYLRVRDQFEPILLPKLVLDTSGALEGALRIAREFLN